MVCLLGSADGDARAERLDAQDLLEDVEALHEQLLFLLAALEEEGPLVEIAVLADLVAAAARSPRRARDSARRSSRG